ncbi:hypothetical protein [Streptomyces tanashiensis]|uniref:ShKT domain-containing protein n=1 Tax=Streptomyces tanashiensis TaxID=67367 RepID=A0ABY6QZ15_9ACTN|nr:hypothetical protein [Streptomyces tanashiensis]UZX21897.1 hypothetical protein LDH80_14725 [Streptomyces tanashiensis]GGY03508.1 hypothetical protein GCM10010299_03000 [Streptomyces tanashiensis]
MKLFTRLGNVIIDRLAPAASAAAASTPCTIGCENSGILDIKQSKCVGATLYVRCCHPTRLDFCTNWYSCGPQCA